MSNHPQTTGEKILSGFLGLGVSLFFFAVGITVTVTGHWGVRGHRGYLTPQDSPWGFWGGVALAFIGGTVALVAGVRSLVEALDDDRN